ncbi:hypothetical protein [Christiangramia echinicola]|uniref:hypothetical protein n=1 Tax=Christiangramia echinicola TaxID=279359 RepID=UPI000B7F16D5|nr:hypothetical protein [Christiangramia echinicola]
MKINIRLFLFYSFFLFLSVSFAQEGRRNQLIYPKISKKPATEIHYGIKIVDEYSNLNKLEDSVVKDWFKAQDSLAESYFAKNDLMKKYLDRFKKLQNNSQSTVSMIRISEAGNYFYLKNDDSLGNEKLFFKEKLANNEKELFDLSQYSKGAITITYLRPSFDGKKIAIGYNENGDFTSKVLIYDLETNKILEDVITHINPDFGV